MEGETRALQGAFSARLRITDGQPTMPSIRLGALDLLLHGRPSAITFSHNQLFSYNR